MISKFSLNYNHLKSFFTELAANTKQKFAVDDAKIRDAVKELLADLLLLQAEGDYEGVKKLIET